MCMQHLLNPRKQQIKQFLWRLNCCPWNHVDMVFEASTRKHSTQRDAVDVAHDHVLVAPLSKHSYLVQAHTANNVFA